MKGLLIRWLLNALALVLTDKLIDGISVDGFGAALIAALVLGIVNAVIRPVVVLLTIPINFITLGLFTLVINGLMLLLAAKVVDGFNVDGFFPAVIGAIVLSIISAVLNMIIKERD
ncbi:MAG: phage holin family protein [Bacillota bacterium]